MRVFSSIVIFAGLIIHLGVKFKMLQKTKLRFHGKSSSVVYRAKISALLTNRGGNYPVG